MKNRNIKVKPGKTQSLLGFVVGILFVILGITIVIPMFGLFGILWTVMAGVCFFTIKMHLQKKGWQHMKLWLKKIVKHLQSHPRKISKTSL